MGERQRVLTDEMATTSAVATIPPQLQEEPAEPVAVITLRPTKPQERKKVVWTEDTVDNENMNKKKSKCCCIYEKPRKFDESSSEEDSDECEHCFGHVERRKKHTHTHQQASTAGPGTSTQVSQMQEEPPEPTTTVALQPAPEPAPAPSPPDKKDPTS
ncbi:E3 ubiquitin-protein ligase PPP1R11-like [Pectinophora gossypiella]|uniref:E3 ubiquitin-protein ligase PPP1R11-like n=1 Tax=Pectinophora gossypiella TaxID=13191 RepID=UPI00214E88A4|nr:E3 ubiquitin-protein ligase PPP1R11-like [Pectinophora gossypiella]